MGTLGGQSVFLSFLFSFNSARGRVMETGVASGESEQDTPVVGGAGGAGGGAVGLRTEKPLSLPQKSCCVPVNGGSESYNL